MSFSLFFVVRQAHHDGLAGLPLRGLTDTKIYAMAIKEDRMVILKKFF